MDGVRGISLRVSPEEAIKNAVRGQYVFGEVKGKAMQAYRQSPDVDPKSRTETYIALKLWIDGRATVVTNADAERIS